MKSITILALSTLFLMSCLATKPQSNQKFVGTAIASPRPSETPVGYKPAKEWSGKVGNNFFSWNGKDMLIRPSGGREAGLFSEFARSDNRFQLEENEAKDCSGHYYYRPLAILGDLMSFESESAVLCGAINTYSWAYSTVQLPHGAGSRSTDEPDDLSLPDLFSERDLFDAFFQNERLARDISHLINRGKIDKAPKNLADLRKLLERFENDFLDGKFYLDAHALQGFAIHDLYEDKVSVWISLAPKSRSFQALREHLILRLPIPDNIAQSLRLAHSRKEGFLMKDAEEQVGSSPAKFDFNKR